MSLFYYDFMNKDIIYFVDEVFTIKNKVAALKDAVLLRDDIVKFKFFTLRNSSHIKVFDVEHIVVQLIDALKILLKCV